VNKEMKRSMLEAEYGILYSGYPWKQGIIDYFETIIIWIKIIFYTMFDKRFRKEYW